MHNEPTNILWLPDAKVEKAVAVSDVRFYLEHPHLDLDEKDKPMLVATNGHILIAAPVEIEGDVSAGPIPIEAIERLRKQRSNKVLRTKLVFDGDYIDADGVLFRRPDFGKLGFPKWRHIVPDYDYGPDITFDEKYLQTISLAMCAAKYPYVSLTLGRAKSTSKVKPIDNTKGIVVRTNKNDGVIAVLMPMRG